MFGEFFGGFYCWLFEDFFGLELAEYLWGQASEQQTSNMFVSIGLTMLAISMAFMLLYYYIINHQRLCNLWGWLIFLGANVIANFLVGWQWTLRHLYEGYMVAKDVNGNEVQLNVDEWNCFNFGITNSILSIFVFIFFSYTLKWWSTNCWIAPENTFYKRA